MKGLSRDVLIYGLGEGSIRALGLISVTIMTRLLTPADYGLIGLATTVASLLVAVVGLGGESTYARWFFDYEQTSERAVTTSTWLFGLGIVSFVVVAIGCLLTPVIGRWLGVDQTAILLVQIAVATVPFTLLNGICGQALRNRLMARQFIILSFSSAVAGLALAIIAVARWDLGALGVMGAGLIIAIIFLPIRLLSIRDLLVLRFDSRQFQAMSRFGFGLVAAGLCYVGMGIVDRWMIAAYRSVDEVGYYGVATMIASVLTLFLAALGQAWSPRFFEMHTRDKLEAARLASRLLTFVLAGFGILAVAITAVSEPLIRILIGEAFWPAKEAIGALTLGMVAYASTQVTAIGVSVKKRPVLLMIPAGLAVLVNVGLNSLLIPRIGFIGAAWATTFSYTVLTIAYAVMTQRLWPIPFEKQRIFLIALVVILGVIAASFISTPSIVTGIAIAVGLTAAVAVPLVMLAGFPFRAILTAAWSGNPSRANGLPG